MKIPFRFPAGALLAPVFIALLASPSPASEPDPEAFSAPLGIQRANPWASLRYDEPGDGRLWAVGASWKASFGAEGAVCFPRTGASEPRSLPLPLSPDSVTIGGETLSFERNAQALRNGARVELDRGAFTERYDLALETVEQSFVFDSLPRTGDLVLRIPVASELEAIETDAGLEFRSERGRITYSRAVTVDARGRHTPAATRIEDGAITIRVAADVLADAEFPLVVDPILNFFYADSSTSDTFSCDAAFDPFNQVWVFVYELVFSASDHDVIAEMYSTTGVFIASNFVDVTSDSWIGPRIADHAAAHKFLVVAGATAVSGGAKTIRGRVIQPNGTLLTGDLQFSVSGATPGSCILPDVGGDATPSATGVWCVVFEQFVGSGAHTIKYCFVNPASGAIGPTTMPTVANAPDGAPSISKSNGGSAWTVTWERNASLFGATVVAARLASGGALITPPFDVGFAGLGGGVCASSPISGTSRSAVVWQSGNPFGPGSSSIAIALLDGGTVLQLADLMTLENSTTAGQDQIQPSVDSDGRHFLISYSEFSGQPFIHYQLFMTDLAVSGDTLQVMQKHVELHPMVGLPQTRSNVAAARGTGAMAHRYLVAYDIEGNSVNHDAVGRFFEGFIGGPTSGFCFGTSTACPCGNGGTVGSGCANSVNAAGAKLQVVLGNASTIADTLVVQITGLPPNAIGLLFQGTTAGVGTPFGDGLRCATGSVIRIADKTASASGGANYPESGNAALSVAGAVPVNGGLRTYQFWYRNIASFCTSAPFNLTNGLAVQWAR